MRGLVVVYLVAAAVSWAGSQGGASAGGVPVFAWCVLLAFALQWLAFVPAYRQQTERYYDLTGSLAFISATLLAAACGGPADARSLLLTLFILVWAARLGSFLFRRIREDGGDSRFDNIKPDPLRFFMTWSLQGLWVVLTAGCAWAALTSPAVTLTPLDSVGIALWAGGFAIEVIADRQKRRFRARAGHDAFIQCGLWARSRHPNYCGEILLWLGIALLALPALQGWQLVTLISPLFVYLLLTRISGIPMLEKKAERKWGEQPDYQAYKARTPLLVPRVF